MNEILIEKLKNIGFQYQEKSGLIENDISIENYWLISPITELDLNDIKKQIGKNHFAITHNYRGLFFGKITNIKNNVPESFWYATSDITGEYKRYRCKNSYEIDIANIFASAKTLDECVEKFIYNYNNRVYNTRG